MIANKSVERIKCSKYTMQRRKLSKAFNSMLIKIYKLV